MGHPERRGSLMDERSIVDAVPNADDRDAQTRPHVLSIQFADIKT